ncbi:MAG: class I SAM-dependent methyltransferase [Vicinamibacteria bacterium]
MASRLATATRRARAAARRRLKARLGPASANGVPGAENDSAAAIADSELWPLRDLYEQKFGLEPISYATVRDYADSTENMPGLAAASADMKNVQRCWMVKAVLGNVERGGRLVEIGAGEPLVAGLLARLGYEVTVVDPYDGSGNGPREYSQFTRAYPDLRFVRDQFPPAEGLDGPYDCVYSISVLEHVPLDAIEGLIAGAAAAVGERAGCQIHAVDHVLAGWSADSHRQGLDRIVAGLGLDAGRLEQAIGEMERDPETYLVSAEAHNQWRGAVPYDSYPMRRIGSVNLFSGSRGSR